MHITQSKNPPVLPDAWEGERQQETLLRTRLLDGEWEQDLERWLRNHIGATRASGWKGVDMSANPFRVLANALSVLYDSPPTVRNSSGDLAGFTDRNTDDTQGLVDKAGVWSTNQRLQARVVGCRQYLTRVSTGIERGKVTLRTRLVSPAFVVAQSKPEAPDIPVRIAEARLRDNPNLPKGTKVVTQVWTWDYLDISDPENPIYRVHLHGVDGANRGRGHFLGDDVTKKVLGEDMSGSDYPYRYSDGTPHLPYVLYHAERGHGCLWTPFEGRELVRGSLNLAVLWSFWMHCMRDASWPQRYMIIASVVCGTTDNSDDGDEARTHIVTDPATVLLGKVADPEVPTVLVGQWLAGSDPKKLAEAMELYGVRLTQDAGISPSSAQKSSGNARSGYSISLDNAGKREQQKRFREPFAWADTMLLAVMAAMVNRANDANKTPTNYPEDGYTIEYAAIPLSPDEMRARDDHIREQMDAGLMSKLEAYTLSHPGVSEKQAQDALDRIATEKALAPDLTPKGGRNTGHLDENADNTGHLDEEDTTNA